MKIIVLGNEFVEEDSLAKRIANKIDFDFIFIKDSFQLLEVLSSNEKFLILDVVENLNDVKILGVENLRLDKIISAHDLDASFVFQILDSDIKIIGIPQSGNFEEIKEKVEKIIASLLSENE